MSKETVKTQIDIDITNKTTSKSISPLNVGNNMKAVVDLIPDFGGSQDLQSVLDSGNISSRNIILSSSFEDTAYETIYDNYGITVNTTTPDIIEYAALDGQNLFLRKNTVASGNQNALTLNPSRLLISDLLQNSSLQIEFQGGNGTYYFPNNTSGVYTLATTDDIKKIDLTDRVYANNAAAITGGLTTNDVYRTATGELRIVV